MPRLQDGFFSFDTAILSRIKYLSQRVEQKKSGSRVSFYDSTGRLVNGTVQSITRTSDGVQLVLIKRDNGGTVTLPLDNNGNDPYYLLDNYTRRKVLTYLSMVYGWEET
ncbi:hypothetical protein ARMGADRAFT_1036515 [Armillaria gallica]|uniref:Uncharacterized protein n=1 Tax=Armillaria gallica TaxID=47427 RepID=A0A2H3CQ89_ARMGA|nr:hypothetical protein ARMGADRAFT_1036515 [Armillaria gallica]